MFKKITNIITSVLLSLAAIVGFSVLMLTANSTLVSAGTTDKIRDGVTQTGGNEGGNSGAQVPIVIKNVINILLFLTGMIAVIMIVIAGFRFVTANGDQNTISSARNSILYAIIGIIVAIAAYAIVNFILDQFT